ncbi:arginine-tRNA-protein transferase [Trametes maxima]|nr:arginine-tRNA-protein transferase [Trametes maxima]
MSGEPISIVEPLYPGNSTCGYCGEPGKRSEARTNYHKAECVAMQLSCRVYQEMIDRGWRRSGTYCYKPDLKRSCCPQYTIKLAHLDAYVTFSPLDALKFNLSKPHRKVLDRFNRFVVHGDSPRGDDDPMNGVRNARKKKKGKDVFNLAQDIHAPEATFLKNETPAHKFEVTLEPSSFTPEKFDLYKSYQKEIHHEDNISPAGFKRFLVRTPLIAQAIDYPSGRPDHLPENYGSYHQLYRLDGELIAMGVIDILPNCVSSVYFMYDNKWRRFSLGKLSALREAALAREIHDAGVQDMRYLYMGFYIHSCQKMRYKGEYSPSYLADPEDYTWSHLEKCRPLLNKYHYACFSHPERSLETPAPQADPTPEIAPEVLENVHHIVEAGDGNRVVVAPVARSQQWQREYEKETIIITLDGLGEKLAQEVVLDLGYDM